MNIAKNFLRTWLSLVSLIGFMMVWLYLVRAFEPKDRQETPTPAGTATAGLSPIPDLDSLIKPVTLTPGSVKLFKVITPTIPSADGSSPTQRPAPQPSVLPTGQPTLAPIALPTATPTLVAMVQTPTSVPPRLRTGAS